VTQVNENDLPAIATTLYGNPQLWWTIAELNSIVDPLTEVTSGTALRVSTQARINDLLSSS